MKLMFFNQHGFKVLILNDCFLVLQLPKHILLNRTFSIKTNYSLHIKFITTFSYYN